MLRNDAVSASATASPASHKSRKIAISSEMTISRPAERRVEKRTVLLRTARLAHRGAEDLGHRVRIAIAPSIAGRKPP